MGLAPGARPWLAAGVVAGVLAALATILIGVLIALAISDVFLGEQGLAGVWPLIVLAAGLAVGRMVLVVAQEALIQRASTRLRDRLRLQLGARLGALGPSWMAGQQSGELAAAIGAGLDSLDAWLTSFRPARTLAAVVPLLVLGVVLVLDPPTALVLLLTGPVLVLLLTTIGSRARAMTDRRHAELRWLSAFFLDMLRGIATLKAFGRSREQADNIAAISRQYGESTMEVLRTAFQTALVLEWAAAVATAVVAVEVSLRLMAGQLAFPTALAVLIITPEFFLPLRHLAIRYHGGAAGRTAAERIVQILGTPPGSASAPIGRPMGQPIRSPGPAVAGVSLDDVWFGYHADAPVLRGLDLRLTAGQLVALVGASGSGKSTAMALLLRFGEPDRGAIRVGDVDVRDLDPMGWRSLIGWTPQRPNLGSGSIADAIALSDPAVSRSDIVAAARLAQADGFIRRLPAGYETPIGEGGVRLSGGQRQRLALARALLRDVPVLALDEPTSHLDGATEAAVVDAIRSRVPGRVVLVVSHRRRLVETADEVVVLDAGRIVQSGSPQELAAVDGPYRRLVAPSDPGPRR
jgi:thiol reductant ABC exporter CydD subunit